MAQANPAHAIQAESKNWTLRTEDDFTVLECTEEVSAGADTAFVDEWVPEIANSDVDTHVLVFDEDGYPGQETFDVVSEAGQCGLEHGIENWVVVANKTKAMALKGKLPREVDATDTDDVEEAFELARQ